MVIICVEYLWIVLSVLELATAGMRFPGRKESILGQTYFNSEQLLNTEIDDVELS